MKQAAVPSASGTSQFQGIQGRVAQLMAQASPMIRAPMPMSTLPAPTFEGMASQDESVRWVEEQKLELQKAEHVTKVAAAESGAFVGIIARLSSTIGGGSIECMESMRQYGMDVQIQQDQSMGLEVGDTVVFRVAFNEQGTPQAMFVRKLGELTQQRQRILDVEAPFPALGAVESAQEYLGFVTSFQADPGFGFISCAQTRQLYGNDVYIHRDQYVDICVGDAVHFRVALNPKGVPVARGVRKVAATSTFVAPGTDVGLPTQTILAEPVCQAFAARAPEAGVVLAARAPEAGAVPAARAPEAGAGQPPPPPPPHARTPAWPTQGPRTTTRGRSRSMSRSMSISGSPTRGTTRIPHGSRPETTERLSQANGAAIAAPTNPVVASSGSSIPARSGNTVAKPASRSRNRRRSRSRSSRSRGRRRDRRRSSSSHSRRSRRKHVSRSPPSSRSSHSRSRSGRKR